MVLIVFLFVMYVLITHWVADFVCQSHWMASNKSKSNVALSLHVATYVLVLFLMMGFPGYFLSGVKLVFILAWVGVNGVLHFITDYFMSRWTSRLWAKNDYHNFFVVVGLDQLIHYGCLFGTLIYLLEYLKI